MTYHKGDYANWSLEKKKKARKQARKYAKENPEVGIYIVLRRNKSRSPDFTLKEFRKWYFDQRRKCFYCNISEKKFYPYKIFRRLEIDRKDNSKGYIFDNMVLACRQCNTYKAHRYSAEQMKIIIKARRILAKVGLFPFIRFIRNLVDKK